MARVTVLAVRALIGLYVSGCASLPETSTTGQIVAFEIGQSVAPTFLRAYVGDEIQWRNMRSGPVRVGLLTNIGRKDLGCAKGFSRFGMVDDFVTIPPGGYASLCLAHGGTVQFNVWFDSSNPRGAISPIATVKISEQSE